MGKKTDAEWLHGYLKTLDSQARTTEADPVDPEYDYHTALKVVAMGYYAKPFSEIAGGQVGQERCDGAVLVDLFAGSGLVRIKGGKSLHVPGSACHAASMARFDGIVCVEKDDDRCALLAERLRRADPAARVKVIRGDCNKKIGDVADWIDGSFDNPMVLVLVDPEGLQINGRTLKALSDRFKRCDFIINVSGHGSQRVAGAVKSECDGDAKRLAEYYMSSDVQDLLRRLEEGSADELYRETVVKSLGKSIGTSIRIKGRAGKLEYYLLGYTRETQRGSRYARIFEYLKPRVEGLDADAVRREFEKIRGKQASLKQSMPRQVRVEESWA